MITLQGLKQQKFILLLFWRSEVWNESYKAKTKVSAGLLHPGGSREESMPSSLAPGVCLHFLPHDPSLQSPFLLLYYLPLSQMFLSSSYENLGD